MGFFSRKKNDAKKPATAGAKDAAAGKRKVGELPFDVARQVLLAAQNDKAASATATILTNAYITNIDPGSEDHLAANARFVKAAAAMYAPRFFNVSGVEGSVADFTRAAEETTKLGLEPMQIPEKMVGEAYRFLFMSAIAELHAEVTNLKANGNAALDTFAVVRSLVGVMAYTQEKGGFTAEELDVRGIVDGLEKEAMELFVRGAAESLKAVVARLDNPENYRNVVGRRGADNRARVDYARLLAKALPHTGITLDTLGIEEEQLKKWQDLFGTFEVPPLKAALPPAEAAEASETKEAANTNTPKADEAAQDAPAPQAPKARRKRGGAKPAP